jgi:hypothetical protein
MVPRAPIQIRWSDVDPMTDREPGAPDDALPADETTDEPLPDEELPGDDGTFQDANPADSAETADDAAAEAESDEAADAEDEDEADYDDEEEADETPVVAPARGGRGGAAAAGRTAPAGPSVAERAVHLEDRASAIFVLAIVATFVGILLYGMLAGGAGFFTPLPTPSPTPTEEPIPSESPSGSPSASPSTSPAASPSGSPGASGSGAPSGSPGASPSGSPGASPSAAPSAAPTVAPSASPSA